MGKDHGQTLTRLFVMPAWWMNRHLVRAAVRELTANDWELQVGGRSDFRCLTMFDADMKPLRRMARKNPGLILLCFTVATKTADIDAHLGIGGTWLKKTSEVFESLGMGPDQGYWDYVRTMGPKPASRKPASRKPATRKPASRKPASRKPATRKPASRKQGGKPGKAHEKKQQVATKEPSTQRSRSRRARTAKTLPAVLNRLVFHGLPDEVERCRELAIDVLPEAVQAATKFAVSGNESYVAGTLEFTTDAGLALKAFNRLVAQVPAVTVTLEYGDVKSGQRKVLRAVDGRIVEHRAG